MVVKILDKSDINRVTIKLAALYFFNITDLVITKFLLHTGMFIEANKIMGIVINNTLANILVKIILPLFLIIILRCRFEKASSKQLAKGNMLVSAVLTFYIIVNCFHIIWIFTYYIVF